MIPFLIAAFFVLFAALVVVGGVYLVSAGWIKPPSIFGNHSASGGPDQAGAVSNQTPWQGTSRVNILLMGLDYRDWQADDTPRTDSMWLITIDPATKTGGMLSIPRDTWVDIPGYGASKINMAYFYGEVDKVPGGGPTLAVQTVENFLSVPIDFYAVIDFKAFTDLIDQLGGVWIDVPKKITVDPLGPGNTIKLKPGRQKLSGEVALAYARNRHTDGGDFDRMQRQMEVILAVRDEIMQPVNFARLITKAPQLYNIVAANVHTNMTLQQAVQLAWLVKDISPDRIHRAMIGPDEVTNSWSWQGWSILLPDMEKINALRDRVFSTAQADPVSSAATDQAAPANVIVDPGVATLPVDTGSSQTAQPTENGAHPGEGVKILVENGTQITGLAKQTADYLKTFGLTVLPPADADNRYNQTMIIDYTGKQDTVRYLANLLKVNPNQILNGSGSDSSADIVVILGDDWAGNNPLP